jgi:REP element-mobilizing transposase RayT
MIQDNSALHSRHSIRLKGYDYASAGLYFITLCVQNREHLFGKIQDGGMILNEYGKIVHEEWLNSAKIRKEIALHEFIIMPDHFHAILEINPRKGDRPVAPKDTPDTGIAADIAAGIAASKGDRPVAPTPHTDIAPSGPPNKSLGALVGGFKSAVTKHINAIRKTPGIPVWQRNYYQHIIRNEKEYDNISHYILNNPSNWEKDTAYGAHHE